jgi:prophage DNA circulation protein
MPTKTDNATLAQIVDDCYMLSIDDRLDPDQRSRLNNLADHLSSQLTLLLSKTFDEGTPALVEANKTIKDVNATIKQFAGQLAGIADTFEQLGKLVSVLDGLLKIPLGFL